MSNCHEQKTVSGRILLPSTPLRERFLIFVRKSTKVTKTGAVTGRRDGRVGVGENNETAPQKYSAGRCAREEKCNVVLFSKEKKTDISPPDDVYPRRRRKRRNNNTRDTEFSIRSGRPCRPSPPFVMCAVKSSVGIFQKSRTVNTVHLVPTPYRIINAHCSDNAFLMREERSEGEIDLKLRCNTQQRNKKYAYRHVALQLR